LQVTTIHIIVGESRPCTNHLATIDPAAHHLESSNFLLFRFAFTSINADGGTFAIAISLVRKRTITSINAEGSGTLLLEGWGRFVI
jgi:hypothetical protein